MNDDINIDCTKGEPITVQPTIPQGVARIWSECVEQLREQLSAERRLNAELRRELDELRARTAKREDQ